MARYLLRVEGVNHANIIDDTDQLSVRRGGGLMLLNLASQLKELLPKHLGARLTPIATGASIALYEWEASDLPDLAASRQEAEMLRSEVAQFLQRDGKLPYHKLLADDRLDNATSELPLSHATFVVDVVRVDDCANEQQAEQLATAANRWRQLQQPTLSLHDIWQAGNAPCALDRTRVANSRCDLPDNPGALVSTTCRDRREYGRGARQRFYEQELAPAAQADERIARLLASARFTNDLRQLAEVRREPERLTGRPGVIPSHLADKLAVFYVDGNKFGAKGRKIFRTQGAEGYRAWSQALRKHHQFLLQGLLEMADLSPQFWKIDDRYRLETLLWGGDEILWIVPAWLGWDVTRWFFSQHHRVSMGASVHELTYACGLVFCHAKAPIKNIAALAHHLGELAKQARPDRHALAYEVLESFDDITGDLAAHRRRFLPADVGLGSLVLDPALLSAHWTTLTQIASCRDFPLRQLYMLCTEWRHGRPPDTPERRLKSACDAAKLPVNEWLASLEKQVGWLHLLQMLPYLPAEDAPKTGDQP
ncbi:MAG: hypothetical protein U0935_08945 [Pirellulales bacterium]